MRNALLCTAQFIHLVLQEGAIRVHALEAHKAKASLFRKAKTD